MSDRIVKTLLTLLFWIAGWGIGAFGQWFVYLQHEKGRVTESEPGFQRRHAKKIWLLLCGLPPSAGKLRLLGAIAQIQALVFAVILLVIGFFFPGIPIVDMNILLFITYVPLGWIIEVIVRMIESHNKRQRG
jgi:hypothetical protein